MKTVPCMLLVVVGLTAICFPVEAALQEASEDAAEVLAGHSYHGEAFNEGPRQQAYLMPGLGQSRFPITTDSPEAQQFFNQGVDQLHGFWYLEAERSFRQVAILDPDCVMAYWGLAMANVNNQDRAKKFIQKGIDAISQKDESEIEVSESEELYLKALAELYDDKTKDKKKRHENYTKKLEEIVLAFPDDLEAKAFLVCQLWLNERAGIKITSHVAVNSLLDQIFAANPNHPSHHYRIHLWDYRKAEIALKSAAQCGPSLPDIAHMWHMPGHIYSKLKRYEDAVWQQEASARIDHRHMMHDQVLPDQIHNFAHNNEWCIRNLNHIGRVQDAIDLAVNMISMPRHPKYNHLDNRGSTWYGRRRLLETLSRYERWSDLIEFCDTPVLEPTDNATHQIGRLRFLGRALARSGKNSQALEIRDQLESLQKERKDKQKSELQEKRLKVQEQTDRYRKMVSMLGQFAVEPFDREFKNRLLSKVRKDHKKRLEAAEEANRKAYESELNLIRRALQEMDGHQLFAEQKFVEAEKKFREAGGVDALFRAHCLLLGGEKEKAIEQAEKHVKGHPNEVQPQSNLVALLWEADEIDKAKAEFEKLRGMASSVDMKSPVFDRLKPIAAACNFKGDWRAALVEKDDLGARPEISSLGPFRWQPQMAPEWELSGVNQETVASKQFQGEPVIVIFYLGHGCLHCAEQLQKFAPMQQQYEEAGIRMIAISTDDADGLQQSIESYGDEPLPIQLVANPNFEVFKKFRAFDEFENQPLHGTFLIDGEGRLRWQDISYEPFMDAEFLLQESQRLLGQPVE